MNFQNFNNYRLSLVLSVSFIILHLFLTLTIFLIGVAQPDQLSFELLYFMLIPVILIFSKFDLNKWGTFLIIFTVSLIILIEFLNITTYQSYVVIGFEILLFTTESTPILPAGGYPLFMPFGWILIVYASYSLTNMILRKDFDSNSDIKFPDIPIRIFIDAIIVWTHALFLEATGNSLGWWDYSITSPKQFFDVPATSLYYYVILALFFSTLLRFGWYFSFKINFSNQNNKSFRFSKLDQFSSLIPTLFIYSWLFLLSISIMSFGFYHWSLLVSAPPILFYSGLIIRDYAEKIQIANPLWFDAIKNKIFINLSLGSYFGLVLFLIIILRIYEDAFFSIIVVFFAFLLVWLINKSNKKMNS